MQNIRYFCVPLSLCTKLLAALYEVQPDYGKKNTWVQIKVKSNKCDTRFLSFSASGVLWTSAEELQPYEVASTLAIPYHDLKYVQPYTTAITNMITSVIVRE